MLACLVGPVLQLEEASAIGMIARQRTDMTAPVCMPKG